MIDTYKTIENPSQEFLYKSKNSKFFSYAFPVTNEEEIKSHLFQIKKQHHQARHWCYAWRLGVDPIKYRANDDGEPSNTAGQPILRQLQSFEVTNILIVVVRYFGGVKLGVSGLISSYGASAELCLTNTTIVTKKLTNLLKVSFSYELMNEVMRKVKKHNLQINAQNFEEDCILFIETPLTEKEQTRNILSTIYGVSVSG